MLKRSVIWNWLLVGNRDEPHHKRQCQDFGSFFA
jgi:hypothetical protein